MGEQAAPKQPTPLEIAKELRQLRGDPEVRREIANTQQRLSRGAQPATSSQVRHTRATW